MLLLTPSGTNWDVLSLWTWTAGATMRAAGSAALTGVGRPSDVTTTSAAKLAVRISFAFVMNGLLSSIIACGC